MVKRFLAACACLALATAVGAPAAAGAIVELPVSFQVVNTNSSGVPCASDGATYTVRGHLVGPRSALAAPAPRTVTVYLHGYNVGEWNWRLPGLPAVDTAARLAELGHVSLTVDRLGYNASGHPYGFQTCLGSQADVAHQLVGKLRRGEYSVTGGRPVAFAKVVLGGHDSGAAIAEIEAYSYADVDALLLFNWAEQGFTDAAITAYAEALSICARGGHQAEQGPPARADPAGGPGGYVQFIQSDADIRRQGFPDAEPHVVDHVIMLADRNPCAEFALVPETVNINQRRLGEIRVPILFSYTGREFLWTREGFQQQAALFTGTRDLTTVVFENAGHFPMLERGAGVFRSAISHWLLRHGFAGATRGTAPHSPARLRLSVRPTRVRAGRRTFFTVTVSVAGATIRFAGRTATSDRRGLATIVTTLGRPGRYRVRASAPGLISATATVRADRPRRAAKPLT